QLASLVDLCHSVARLNANGISVNFDIMSPAFQIEAYREALSNNPAVRLIEPTQDEGEFCAALAAADALVLPINFDAETVQFIRYSMPTKVPAYMAVGTPILVYGPRGVTQVDYAARDGWGHVVSERRPEALDSQLHRILTDPDLREALRLRAQALARTHHDPVQARTHFQDELKAAARASQ